MNRRFLAEIAGWYGIIAILLAYMLVSFKLVPADGYIYQLLNLTGALGVIIISIVKRLQQTIVLNAVWLIIALVALCNLIFHA